jgi:hypothetical protein
MDQKVSRAIRTARRYADGGDVDERSTFRRALDTGMDYAGRGLALADLYSGGMLSSVAGLNPFGSYQGVMEARERALAGVPREAKAAATEPFTPYAAIFAGPMARTANRKMLQRAEELAAQNAPREQIWNETGWFKGVDGKWRFEIDDSQATLQRASKEANALTQPPSMDQVYRHDDLYAAYPELRDVRWRPTEDYKVGHGAYGRYPQASPETPPGIIFTGYHPDKPFASDLGALDVLPHEWQHAVQYIENTAKGGSPKHFNAQDVAAERARRMAAEPPVSDWSSVGTYDPSIPDSKIQYDLYKRLAGENEAEATRKRKNMYPSERRARAPWLDYDVPEQDQIVRFR